MEKEIEVILFKCGTLEILDKKVIKATSVEEARRLATGLIFGYTPNTFVGAQALSK